jgi:hypothetical protein
MREEFEKYRGYVDHLDLSEDRKEEFIETVYSIVEAFVDRGFDGYDSVHIDLTDAEISGFRAAKRVKCEHSLKNNNNPTGRNTP